MSKENNNTSKRDELYRIQEKMQEEWEAKKLFETNVDLEKEKYFATFPYPYMNGQLHLGHSFTIAKVEFMIGYQKLKGKNCLFPFSFHCTGMPIKACADKLKNEMLLFGENFDKTTEMFITKEENESKLDNKTNKRKGGKVLAKKGNETYQYQIMQSLNIKNEEIKEFSKSDKWLEYFPPLAKRDVKTLGCKVDWRRSFITTDKNKFYDSFARWQFRELLKEEKIKFGKRYTIFSMKDQQPCMDHDRQSGEGVRPTEYLCVKQKIIDYSNSKISEKIKEMKINEREVFFVCATLRPETMYGQTNIFVANDIEYVVFEGTNNELYITTYRAALNMAHQGITRKDRVVEVLLKVQGKDFVGCKVKAPLSIIEAIHVLPMESILENKGTGVVTSVPTESPDDYTNVLNLAKKPDYYEIKKEWVNLNFKSTVKTSSINVEEGEFIAKKVCEQFKINGPNDKELLQKAKEVAYKEAFYDGVMLVGDFKDMKVTDAKPRIHKQMVEGNMAFVYSEPESVVMSRSGEECVVALCDQWYIDYGEESWKKKTKECVDLMQLYHPESRNQFNGTLEWLNAWACARSFGLGSKVPWDESFLIESLSDSTIYMAYYTIAHFLQGNSFDSSQPNEHGIEVEDMSDDVWNYIFRSKEFPMNSRIPRDTLEKMKQTFEYFYPLDLRVSGKDLIPNHLTFSVYNHTALFEKEKWPKSFYTNGFLLLNGNKMSKSSGNFLTLSKCVELYGADATRLTLADAGDGLEDANFEESVANAAILRLYNLLDWVKATIENEDNTLRSETYHFYDNVFLSELQILVNETEKCYSKFQIRDALKHGFYEMLSKRDIYRESCNTIGIKMHRKVVHVFIETMCIVMSPIIPHLTDYIFQTYLKKGSILQNVLWPSPIVDNIDYGAVEGMYYILALIKNTRDMMVQSNKSKKKTSTANAFDPTKPKILKLIVATNFPDWQEKCIKILKENYTKAGSNFNDKILMENLKQKGLIKNKKTMPFVMFIKRKVDIHGEKAFDRTLLFDEIDVLSKNKELITKTLDFEDIEITIVDNQAQDETNNTTASLPGEPAIKFYNK